MTWIHKAPRPHECAFPAFWKWKHKDSIWECECGQRWIIVVDHWGDKNMVKTGKDIQHEPF